MIRSSLASGVTSRKLKVPAPMVQWRVLRPRRRPGPGTFAWWLSRFCDPQDLVGFKAGVLGLLFVAASLSGP
jgi:hypothetical protein